jgi:hypothetical protein
MPLRFFISVDVLVVFVAELSSVQGSNAPFGIELDARHEADSDHRG